jgi:N-acetylmuramoyl-L-alanine amidase
VPLKPGLEQKDTIAALPEKTDSVRKDTLALKTEPAKNETVLKKDSVKAAVTEKPFLPKADVVPALLFRVQIATSAKPLPENSERFKAAGGEKIYSDITPEGLHKYMTGSFTEMEQALDHQKKMREKGYADAFVVAYKDGKRIPIQEALQLVKGKK